jgi:hypothetical protein
VLGVKVESQTTKPQLANHDHQALIQTEPDDNAKDSALKLALKHPAQTTANWGLVFWDSAFSLLICSWFGVSQSWSFLSLWGWVSARCGGVRTITSESCDDFDAGIRVRILHSDEDHPTTRGTLENLDLISQVTQQPIPLTILTPESLLRAANDT